MLDRPVVTAFEIRAPAAGLREPYIRHLARRLSSSTGNDVGVKYVLQDKFIGAQPHSNPPARKIQSLSVSAARRCFV